MTIVAYAKRAPAGKSVRAQQGGIDRMSDVLRVLIIILSDYGAYLAF
jgi:hypothetical protein